jgi:nitroreductase
MDRNHPFIQNEVTMEFFDVVHNRRSTRRFTDQPVEDDQLQQILEAINASPSAGNMQAYEVYVVRDLQVRKDLAKASYDQEFIAQAPVVLVFCTHAELNQPRYGMRGINLYAVQDATIACTIAALAARSLELGSVWVGAFDEASVHEIIGSPKGQTPVAMLPIGVPAKWPGARPRRPLTDLVHEL